MLSKLRRFVLGPAFYLIGMAFSTIYLWSYLAQSETTLRTVVFGIFLTFSMLSLISWKAAVYTFIFCVPLFNTLPSILGINDVWPPFSFNFLFVSALATGALFYKIADRPLDWNHRRYNIPSTPFDFLWGLLMLLVWSTAIVGCLRYNNLFCPGFFSDLPLHLTGLPFATQTDNYLCFTRALQLTASLLSFYFVCSVLHSQKDVFNVFKLLLLSATLVCVYAVWQYQTKSFLVGIQSFFGRVNATFNGPDSAATYFVVIIMLSFAFFWHAKKVAGFLFTAFLLTVAIVGLALTGTRTAAFAMVIAVLFVLILTLIRTQQVFKYLPALAIVIAVYFFFAPGNSLRLPFENSWQVLQNKRFFQGIDQLANNPRRIDEWLSFRSFHWFAAKRAANQAPITGQGLGTFDKLYRNLKAQRDQYDSAFAHNLYLDYLIEMGSLGFFVSIAFYVVALLLCWRIWSGGLGGKKARAIAIALMAALLSIAVGNLFSSSFYYVLELMMFQAVLLALLTSIFNQEYPAEEPSLYNKITKTAHALFLTPKRRLAVAGVFILLASVYLWRLSVSARAGEAQYYSCEPYTRLGRILEYGVDHYEVDNNGNKFARTGKQVFCPLKVHSRKLMIYLRAAHPDAEQRPVSGTFTVNGNLAGSVVLSNRNWTSFILDVATALPAVTNEDLTVEGKFIPISLGLTSGRLWNPLEWNPEERNIEYGIDLGTIIQGLF